MNVKQPNGESKETICIQQLEVVLERNTEINYTCRRNPCMV